MNEGMNSNFFIADSDRFFYIETTKVTKIYCWIGPILLLLRIVLTTSPVIVVGVGIYKPLTRCATAQ